MKQFLKLASVIILISTSAMAGKQHGIAMHGDLKYASDFKNFDYVNPDAPKGGEVKLGLVGTFDSLNPLILKGAPAGGIRELQLESLMKRSPDEPFSLYGLIAESLEVAPDRSWVVFNLRDNAKWSDGKPITADDVLFSWETLKEKGRANLRTYYKKVAKAEKLSNKSVKFTFSKDNGNYDAEMPMIMGLMAILPKHVYTKVDIEKTGIKPLVGSGPYKIAKVDPGKSITYVRRQDYWGKDLPVNRGYYNADKITYDYYRDGNVMFEAFKAGNIDFREEIDSAKWATKYDFKAVKDGQVVKVDIPHSHQVGMMALAFNTRNPIFSDIRVRKALYYAFDFDWINQNMQHGAMTRTKSFFDNTEFAATGLPSSEELELLAPYKDKLSAEVFEAVPTPPTFGPNKRKNLSIAQKLLKDAGWILDKGVLKDAKTGKPFEFEILLNLPENEKIALSFARDLKSLGIKANVRTVDSSQYENRRIDKQFDMIITMWGHTMSPGNEQAYYWSSKAADEAGTRNYPGIKSESIDAMCKKVAEAKTRKDLVLALKTLDRLLLSGYYVIPFGHRTKDHVAYNKKLGHPDFKPIGVPDMTTWWVNKS